MSNTYGTWPPGDPRGFRTRGHREHVQGDYKQPPPRGRYDDRLARARRLMKRSPVHLSLAARAGAVQAIGHALVDVHGLEMLALAVSGEHLHVLVRLSVVKKPTALRRGLRERDPARYFMGIAKERSAKKLAADGLVAPGGVWAKRGKIVGIVDRAHQVHVYRYVLRHVHEGAVAWSFRDGVLMPAGA